MIPECDFLANEGLAHADHGQAGLLIVQKVGGDG
jgi:hypothetical protein